MSLGITPRFLVRIYTKKEVDYCQPLVPRTRLELARANAHYPLKVACLPISPPGPLYVGKVKTNHFPEKVCKYSHYFVNCKIFRDKKSKYLSFIAFPHILTPTFPQNIPFSPAARVLIFFDFYLPKQIKFVNFVVTYY